MGRTSTKENKSIYQTAREEAGLTRAQASEALKFISESSLEKIESGKTSAKPEDVMAMARAYKKPELCNMYCSGECEIGIANIPAIEAHTLPEISLQILSTLNTLETEKNRLIDITADGEISDDEISDFMRIKDHLEQISLTADGLKLWVDKAIAEGTFPDA